jgi:hypothetical protein
MIRSRILGVALLPILLAARQASAAEFSQAGIRPWTANPRYCQYKGRPRPLNNTKRYTCDADTKFLNLPSTHALTFATMEQHKTDANTERRNR